MSEDRFFQQVKSVMSDYSPEVPGHVYQGVRKKMWWSNFMRFDAIRLNIWYIALAFAVITAVIFNVGQPASSASENIVAPESNVAPTDAPAINVGAVTNEPQSPAEVSTVRNTAVEKTAPVTSHPKTEQKVTTDVAEVEASKEVEQPKIEEPQQMKNESQAPAKANKRGLKVKTYSPESDKK